MAKKKAFSKDTTSYDAPEAETPYNRAKKEWDDRIGSSRVQAKSWRFVAVFALLLSLLLVILLGFCLTLHKNTVYVAQVTKAGQVVNVAPLELSYQPSQAQEEYFVSHFIQISREIPLDPVVAKKNWMNAYAFLTRRAAAEFNRYMTAENPLKLLGKETVTVKITDINPLSPNSYQVNWTETTIDTVGKQTQTQNYSGVFTTVVKQPTTQKQILENPLGIYIANFDVSVRDKK